MANIHVLVDGDTVVNVVSGADPSFFTTHPEYSQYEVFDFTGKDSWPSPGWTWDGADFIGPNDVEGQPVLLQPAEEEEETVHPNANNVPGLNPEE